MSTTVKPLAATIVAVIALVLGGSSIAHADFTKTIQVNPGVQVNAVTTWYYANCTTSLGIGTYTVNVPPAHGVLAFANVSGPVPGCPAGSPSLPAVAAYYTWTDPTTAGSSDSFQLYYNLNGQVAEVQDISVVLFGGYGDIVVDFGPTFGLWLNANHAGPAPQWLQLNGQSPTRLAKGDVDGDGTLDVIATFKGNGVWIWKSRTGWTQLHPLDATDIVTGDLDGNGKADIILNFPGAGLWVRYNETSWQQLHALNCAHGHRQYRQ